ncbi:hypothetical protein [Paractinoplanes atraurantiacus]|uniref:PH domain-containing protein n=1 Tax=Paractinoplanes atraurantiacus TaxID=1036182 RepID=A0A285IZR8_9ACTN|nr:hypothetical protein [Actinoplanes atraurantiacus]SNY53147.1 hypothetical protein SAMN05421748_113195 [Actinoplanes atraurantiacus]
MLGESRAWPAIVLPAALLMVALAFRKAFFTAGFAIVAAAVIVALARRRNAILADEEGLLIRDRHGLRRSYAWTAIERIGWTASPPWGASLTVCPAGKPYDVPGPNSPVEVAGIWPARRRSAPDPLPGLMRRHGIRGLYAD